MASEWNLWVWLECMGVVIIIITFPYSPFISSFLAAASLFLCSFLKCFFVLYYLQTKHLYTVNLGPPTPNSSLVFPFVYLWTVYLVPVYLLKDKDLTPKAHPCPLTGVHHLFTGTLTYLNVYILVCLAALQTIRDLFS